MSAATVLRLAVVSFAGLAFATDLPAAEPENPGPNVNLLRQAGGRYEYRALSDGRERGVEEFKLLVHRDGSRTMMVWHDLWAKNAQFTAVLRVAEDFRPLTAFASYWVANGFKGSTMFQVDGNRLRATGTGANGDVSHEIEVPHWFSIGTHPVAADGWHLWYAAAGADEDAVMLDLYSLEATADIGKPVLGRLIQMPCEIVGEAVVETPAGRFDTMHYRLAGTTDLWVTGRDRILVRMIMEKFDREYELVEFSAQAFDR